MMGSLGKRSRMERTTSAVCLPAATLTMEAPASMRAWMSSSPSTTVTTTGMSMIRLMSRRLALLMGEFTTTPKAP